MKIDQSDSDCDQNESFSLRDKFQNILFYILLLVQCHDIDNANRVFSTIVYKTNTIYGAMFKG